MLESLLLILATWLSSLHLRTSRMERSQPAEGHLILGQL